MTKREILECTGIDIDSNSDYDLFEYYDKLTGPISELLNKYEQLFEDMDYIQCREFVNEAEKIGFTCDFGLSSELYDLRLITT